MTYRVGEFVPSDGAEMGESTLPLELCLQKNSICQRVLIKLKEQQVQEIKIQTENTHSVKKKNEEEEGKKKGEREGRERGGREREKSSND